MRLQIDRDLPVPIPVQLQGQIEYGVTNGDFPPGSRLPSVRDLAAQLGVSPVTVSSVYQKLQASGLIESTPGRGTIVRDTRSTPSTITVDPIDQALRRALQRGDRAGLSRADLIERFQRLATHRSANTPIRCTFVGVFPNVTRAYVADLKRHLAPHDELVATTFQELDEQERTPIENRDLLFTFAHRVADLEALSPPGARIESVALIPSERTRVALAEIDPLARVVLVNAVPEFVVTFRRAVERFASHVASITTAVLGAPDLPDVIAGADVVVYATGAESIVDGLLGDVRAFEYRHVPDPTHVETVLLPLIERIRDQREDPHTPQEDP